MNKILEELIKFCYEERISIIKFELSTPKKPTTAKGIDFFGEPCKMVFKGKWVIK